MSHVDINPKEIKKVEGEGLAITWADGHVSPYAWGFLRSVCPCATCREGGLPQAYPDVAPAEISPVGNYAVHFRWADGHSTGIYTFELLRSLCFCSQCRKPTTGS